MIKHIDRRKIRIYAAITSFVLSCILMSLSFYIAYQEAYYEAVKKLQYTAEHTRLRFEHIIRPIDKTLRKMQQLNHQCSTQTQKALQEITFNSPTISLAFINKGKMSCSNFGPHAFPFNFESPNDALILSGPLTLDAFQKPIFILSRLHKGYRYGAALTEEGVKSLLPNTLNKYMFSALVQFPGQQIYLHKGAYSKPNHIDNSDFTTQKGNGFQDKIYRLHLTLKLSNFKNVYLFTALSTTWIWSQLSLHFYTIITLGLLLCSIAIYFIYIFTKRKLSLKSAMETALKDGEFLAHYQPVIDLKSNRISGVECLLRWQPEDESMIFPDSFIPTAEDSGLIKPITDNLIEKVFQDLGVYLSLHPAFHVSINLTPLHFENEDIIEQITSYCTQYSVNHNQIIFELTERKLIEEDSKDAVEIMKELRKQGFALALDDFGTGYSSMSYLQRFPFDYLKIDRQFIMAIGSGAVTEDLAHGIILMAKQLNLKIVAEGIETKPQLNYLKKEAVEYAQGWLFSKALSKKALMDFLKDWEKD